MGRSEFGVRRVFLAIVGATTCGDDITTLELNPELVSTGAEAGTGCAAAFAAVKRYTDYDE